MTDQNDEMNKPKQGPGQSQPMTQPKPDQGGKDRDLGQGRKAGDEDLERKKAPTDPDRDTTERIANRILGRAGAATTELSASVLPGHSQVPR